MVGSLQITLGISWSCKRRKLNGLHTSDLESSRQDSKSHNAGSCPMLISNPQPSFACQDGGLLCCQRTLDSSVKVQRNKFLEDSVFQSYISLLQNDTELPNCYRSNPSTMSALNFVYASHQHICVKDPKTRSSPALGGRGRSETQVPLRFTSLESEKEPVGSAKSQFLRRDVQAVRVPELPQKNNMSLQIKADEVMCERLAVNDNLTLVKNVQHAIQGNPHSQIGMPMYFKEEPIETSDSYAAFNRTGLLNQFLLDARNKQNPLQFSQLQHSSSLCRTDRSKLNSTTTPNSISAGEIMNDTYVARKAKASWAPPATCFKSAAGSEPAKLSLIPEKCRSNPRVKDISMEVFNFFASTEPTGNINGKNQCTLPSGNLIQDSELSVDPLFDRFMKIESVTHRYAPDCALGLESWKSFIVFGGPNA